MFHAAVLKRFVPTSIMELGNATTGVLGNLVVRAKPYGKIEMVTSFLTMSVLFSMLRLFRLFFESDQLKRLAR